MQHTVLVLFLSALLLGPALSVQASSLDGSTGPHLSHYRATSSGEALPPASPHGPGGDDDHEPPPAKKQGCSVVGDSAPGSLALLLPLLALAGRRQR